MLHWPSPQMLNGQNDNQQQFLHSYPSQIDYWSDLSQ